MTHFTLNLPPGVQRNGTELASAGRYYDAWLVRWTEDGTLKPIGGWRRRGTESVSGAARALFPWKDNNGTIRLAIGTHSGLFVQNRQGDVFDITPAGFTVGRADAEAEGGYGDGDYGIGDYGTPRPDTTLIQNATQWTFDSFGQLLIGVSPDDNILLRWDLDDGTDAVSLDAAAPDCKAVVVTAEGFVFALGLIEDPRAVAWCDQRNYTIWTPDATNQAGDYALQTQGELMCGKNIKGGTLLFTDLDVHLATWIGGTYVYSFDKLASACGIISRQAAAAIDAQAVWMGKSSFWLYNGYVQPLPCDVQDYVFSDFNTLQASKTYAVRDSANSEVQFYYCSNSSNEIDRCVVWNYKYNYWNIGRVPRTCGADQGVFIYPIFVDADGAIWEHEAGLAYTGAVPSKPYAECGPVRIGAGENVVRVMGIVPDEKTSGDTEVTFHGKFLPNGTEQEFGPYAMAEKVDVMFTARQTKLRVGGKVLSDWRFGAPVLDGVIGGKR